MQREIIARRNQKKRVSIKCGEILCKKGKGKSYRCMCLFSVAEEEDTTKGLTDSARLKHDKRKW
jgi:hypothetical protein